jgi:hypothetical protein
MITPPILAQIWPLLLVPTSSSTLGAALGQLEIPVLVVRKLIGSFSSTWTTNHLRGGRRLSTSVQKCHMSLQCR